MGTVGLIAIGGVFVIGLVSGILGANLAARMTQPAEGRLRGVIGFALTAALAFALLFVLQFRLLLPDDGLQAQIDAAGRTTLSSIFVWGPMFMLVFRRLLLKSAARQGDFE